MNRKSGQKVPAVNQESLSSYDIFLTNADLEILENYSE